MKNEAEKHIPKQLQPYTWKKGQSGNPNGRPKGKTLKEFAREYLMTLPDDEKIEFLASLPTEIVWKMAEGNPQTNTDITSKGEQLFNEEAKEKANELIKGFLGDREPDRE